MRIIALGVIKLYKIRLYCLKRLTKDLIFYIIFPKAASTTKRTVIRNARCRFFDNKKAETVYQSLLFSFHNIARP